MRKVHGTPTLVVKILRTPHVPVAALRTSPSSNRTLPFCHPLAPCSPAPLPGAPTLASLRSARTTPTITPTASASAPHAAAPVADLVPVILRQPQPGEPGGEVTPDNVGETVGTVALDVGKQHRVIGSGGYLSESIDGLRAASCCTVRAGSVNSRRGRRTPVHRDTGVLRLGARYAHFATY